MKDESLTESLTDVQWKIIHDIANTLATEQLRINKEIGKDSDGIVTELKKTITYLYANQDHPDAGAKFFTYLKTLVGHGQQVGHSGKTTEYYRCIKKACKQHLQDEQVNPRTMLLILGWVGRLVRYEKDSLLNREVPGQKVVTVTKPKIRQPESNFKYKEGQTINAKIIDCTTREVDSKKAKTTITYEFEGEKIGKTEEIYNMHKKGISLQVSEVVKLKIIKVENGIIKKYERQ